MILFDYMVENIDFPCFWQKRDQRTDRRTDASKNEISDSRSESGIFSRLVVEDSESVKLKQVEAEATNLEAKAEAEPVTIFRFR